MMISVIYSIHRICLAGSTLWWFLVISLTLFNAFIANFNPCYYSFFLFWVIWVMEVVADTLEGQQYCGVIFVLYHCLWAVPGLIYFLAWFHKLKFQSTAIFNILRFNIFQRKIFSVRITYESEGFDGRGAIYDYVIAKCPCVVGCLWMVSSCVKWQLELEIKPWSSVFFFSIRGIRL